jgi:hypothetical protein
MELFVTDGGRAQAGVKAKRIKDCVTRSIATLTGRSYAEVHQMVADATGVTIDHLNRYGTQARPRGFKKLMAELGFVWVQTMNNYQRQRVHMRAQDLPSGRIICYVSGHYVAVIDGVQHDLTDCSRGGRRMVYGIWKLEGQP